MRSLIIILILATPVPAMADCHPATDPYGNPIYVCDPPPQPCQVVIVNGQSIVVCR